MEDGVDVSFFKKLLSQIKGVKEVETEDEIIKKAITKSREQVKNGNAVEYSDKLIDDLFQKK